MSAQGVRIFTWIAAVVFAAALTGYLVHDARQRDYKACIEANEGRAVIRQFIAAASKGDPYYVDLAAKYLGPRDCEELR